MELEEHIDDIRKGLKQNNYTNEASVRRSIVDPLLTALGWSTDPKIVIPEYTTNKRRVDYALCHPELKPRVFIEVKQVGNIDGAERQLFEYAFHEGIPILILTDGQKWRFFHPSGSGDYAERLVHEFDIVEDDNAEVVNCLNRYLNYTSVQAGEAMTTIAEDYKNVFRNREILRSLPQAWDNLVSGQSENSEFLIEAVKSETERLCGNSPTDEQVFNFLKGSQTESRIIMTEDPPPAPVSHPKSGSSRAEKYTAYFQVLLDELREQHNFTNARRPGTGTIANYYSFASGTSGITYFAGFNGKGVVYTSMRISFGAYEKNKNFFDVLKERESEINAKFDSSLLWERRDDILGCSISLEREGNIESDARALEAIKASHIQNLLKFKEIFTPEIQRALDKLKSSESES